MEPHASGIGLAETLAALALAAVVLAVGLPALAEGSADARAAAGARHLALTLHALRWRSVGAGRVVGLRFARDGQGVWWQAAADGNGNGLRSAEIASGVDPRESRPERLEHRVPGSRLGFPPGGPYPALPPARGSLDHLEDPVRFGVADIVSFSPLGNASSGTLYVTDGLRSLYAVVLYGPTARVRVWRYDRGARRWTL